ncbi:MAG: ACT domain-containing protein, partial [Flavobacteriales bacterium]
AYIMISGIDHMGLVNEVTKIISENMHVNMKSLSFETNDGLFSGKINLIVNNNSIIKKVVDMLKKINGIDKVYRV